MSYYRICPNCGCSLDPGERCDCMEEKAKEKKQRNQFNELALVPEKGGQFRIDFERLRTVG